MLTKKRAYKLSITLITFLFGAAFQFLLAQWLPSGDVIPLLSMLILVSLVLILIISSDMLSALENVYGGTVCQDSFWAKIRQNSTVRETRGYAFRYTCAGV